MPVLLFRKGSSYLFLFRLCWRYLTFKQVLDYLHRIFTYILFSQNFWKGIIVAEDLFNENPDAGLFHPTIRFFGLIYCACAVYLNSLSLERDVLQDLTKDSRKQSVAQDNAFPPRFTQ